MSLPVLNSEMGYGGKETVYFIRPWTWSYGGFLHGMMEVESISPS